MLFENSEEIAWTWLSETHAKAELGRHGVARPAGAVAGSVAEALEIAARLRPPFVVKVAAAEVIHKSDVGGVQLNLTTPQQVAGAAEALLSRFPSVLVEEQTAPGLEMVVGARSTNGFGPVVMVGLGGVWVELLRDVVFGFAPLTLEDAHRLLRQLVCWPLLDGARGGDGVDVTALAHVMVAVGALAVELSDRPFEIDVNPVLAGPTGAVAVDAVIGHGPPRPKPDASPRPDDLSALFNPRMAGVFGADPRRPNNGNGLLAEYRRAGRDAVVAVHPEAESLGRLEGAPTRASVAGASSEAPIDLLSITGPAEPVLSVIAQAGPGAMIHLFSGPFTEDRELRQRWKAQVLSTARAAGNRVLGPNAMGVHCPAGGLSFVPGASLRTDGRVAAVLQSGGLAADLVSRGEERGIGFSAVVSAGDALDIGVDELYRHLLADEATDVIGLYVETAEHARGILEAARAATRSKATVILTGGRTPRGAAAAASHTGALAEDTRLWAALTREIGAVAVDSLEDLVTSLAFLERATASHAAAVAGAEAVLLVGTGGDGVLGSDLLSGHGISVPDLDASARAALDALGTPGVGRGNPIDLASLGAVLNYRAGDRILDDVVGAVLANQRFTDVVFQLGVTSLFLYFDKPAELLDRIVASASRLPARHTEVRFTVVVQASGDCVEEGKRVAHDLAEAGFLVVYAMRDAAIGLRALEATAR